MKLKIRSVADKGVVGKERLVVKVVDDANVGEFLVLCTGFVDGQVNIAVTNTYWFPDKEVRSGDLVILYTKAGTNGEKVLDSGSKAHFFYWGVGSVIWSPSDKAAVLLHAPVWESSGSDEL